MPIAQLLELWKKIEVEPMEVEVSGEQQGHFPSVCAAMDSGSVGDGLRQGPGYLTYMEVRTVL